MNADTTSPHIFTIPAPNLSRLQERIAELNRRAKRIESPDIAIETLSVDPSRDTLGAVTLVYRVRVSGTAPKVAGWTFAAVLEHTEDGTIIRTVPGAAIEESTVARYRDVPPRCEYCNTVRRRHDTYLLSNEQGELKQVGSTCLKDFTGHEDPTALAQQAELLALAGEACATCESNVGFGGARGASLDLEYYLSWVHACTRFYGWVSRSKAEDAPLIATADRAVAAMEQFWRSPRSCKVKLTDYDKGRTAQALAWIRDGDREGEEFDIYLHNLAVVCKGIAVAPRQQGLAASLFLAYDNALERDLERRYPAALSHYQGEVGKALRQTLTCYRVNYRPSTRGTLRICEFIDVDGNRYTWFSSYDVVEVGNTYQVDALVKAHQEYRGTKSTVLSHYRIAKQGR